ncbi:hypothetical protein SDRG_11451 [Saprolegnia diclina VS20]|uniref:Uncharacterized protein n=1 Tax=Saprolegnia diclina (strain VS20) TaxID=1156394 RepID=T0RFB6_SAPDV|nr:hypothetical protein SDRG_11451 [Saprolegnia diclina VS20]EQC30978.1 hypothetical protein SDRG_11451 [Saprolegnia diclina VS20]|eukprot:XP_008615716.1 hypothetical protein SDRG_11451 [Saprolegnia diclina VS20]
MERAFAPNAWELPTFVGFLQGISLLSLVRNANVPQLFYMNFLDSLSWLNFLIRAPASSASTSTVASVQLVSHRQLASTSSYDASGYIDFSLRANVGEKDWFFRLWATVLVVLAVLLLVVVVTAVVAKCLVQRGNPFHSETSDSHKRSVSLRSISRRLLGMCVTVVYFAILPLSMVAMFEVLLDTTSTGFPHTNAVLSMVTLALLVGVLVAGAIAVHRKTEAGLSKWHVRVVWGVVYGPYLYSHRLFFVVTALVQLLSGVLVASVSAAGAAPLIALIALRVVYVVLIAVVRPFQCNIQLWCTLVFEALLVVMYGVAAGLTPLGLEVGTQKTLSYVVVIIVVAIVLVVFLRQLLMLWNFASGWAKPDDVSYSGIPTAHEHDWESSGANYTISIPGADSSSRDASAAYSTDNMPNTIRLVPSTHPTRSYDL